MMVELLHSAGWLQAPGAMLGEGADQTILTTAGTDRTPISGETLHCHHHHHHAQPQTLQSSLGWSHYSYYRQTLRDITVSELLCDNIYNNITTRYNTHILESLFSTKYVIRTFTRHLLSRSG